MTSTSKMPPSDNQVWGFVGTIAHHADANAAWPLAMTAIADATGCTPDEVSAFLDSRHGRHFADDAANALVDGHPLVEAITTPPRNGWAGRSDAPSRAIPASPRDCPISPAS